MHFIRYHFLLYFASTLTHAPDANDVLDDFDFYGSSKGILSGSDVPSDTAMSSRADIAASVRNGTVYVWMNDIVGALVTYLEDNGLYNETLVIFQTDNGMNDKGDFILELGSCALYSVFEFHNITDLMILIMYRLGVLHQIQALCIRAARESRTLCVIDPFSGSMVQCLWTTTLLGAT